MRAQPHQNIYLFLDDLPNVILGLIIDASFFRSAKAARGRPQFATFFSKRIQVFFSN